MGWIILVNMTIAGPLIIWTSSCNGFLCELLPVLLLMIDIIATIIILVIGSVINIAVKTTKGSVLDNENRTDNDGQEKTLPLMSRMSRRAFGAAKIGYFIGYNLKKPKKSKKVQKTSKKYLQSPKKCANIRTVFDSSSIFMNL